MRPRRISLHVDELVLSDLDDTDPASFAAAFRSELGDALLDEDVAAALGSSARVDVIRAGTAAPGTGADPEAFGAGVARAVARGLVTRPSEQRAGSGDGSVTQQ